MAIDYRDKTPFIEIRAWDKKLEGIKVVASTYPQGREVPVIWVGPDFELRNAQYPGIYLSYAGFTRATDREHRGPTNLMYAPPGMPTDVLVPADMSDKDSVATAPWDEAGTGFERDNSPYRVEDTPVPYNLDFNVTVLTRNNDQMFQVIQQLMQIDRIPERFGGLEVPEDGTVRTLELLGGPDTTTTTDADGKRVLQTVYSVRVAAELDLYGAYEVDRVTTTNVTLGLQQTDYL